MAFSDWDLYSHDSGILIQSSTPNSIVGDTSLNIASASGVTGGGNAVPSDSSGLAKGLTAGRMRSLVNVLVGTGGADNAVRINCMQNADDLSSSATFYTLEARLDGTWVVRRVTSGDFESTGTIIGSGTWAYPGATNVWAMELLWFLDVSEFSGVRFAVQFGVTGALDYTDLADPTTGGGFFDDTSGFLVSSGAEGVGADDFGSTSDLSVLFDKVQLYQAEFV